MQNIPIKRYFLRRFTKWLKRLLISESYSIKRLIKKWKKNDIPPLSSKEQKKHIKQTNDVKKALEYLTTIVPYTHDFTP